MSKMSDGVGDKRPGGFEVSSERQPGMIYLVKR